MPATLTPLATTGQRATIKLEKQTEITFATGYTRSLKAGSQWLRIGTIAQGDVYKPTNDIFTLEGKHVHEAYLVIVDHHLTGFYLPVERGFSPLISKIALPFYSTH